MFWTINGKGNVEKYHFSDYMYDLALLNMGNCFPTKRQPRRRCPKYWRNLRRSRKECWSDMTINNVQCQEVVNYQVFSTIRDDIERSGGKLLCILPTDRERIYKIVYEENREVKE